MELRRVSGKIFVIFEVIESNSTLSFSNLRFAFLSNWYHHVQGLAFGETHHFHPLFFFSTILLNFGALIFIEIVVFC